jgi:cis-3-alkyl-4-acyloxetan-2-one decarboxylase
VNNPVLKFQTAYPDYPFQSHFLALNGHNLHYLDEGPRNAPPVLMLHGNPTWSFYYRRLIAALSADYRCIAPDHMGMGLSDKPPDSRYRYTLASRVDDLERLLDSLFPEVKYQKQKVKNLTLILHDWGGMIGMAYATRHPERISRLILLNTGAFTLPKTKPLPWQLKLARSPLGTLLVRGFNAFSKGAVKSCVTRCPLPPNVAAAYLAPYNSWHNRLAVHRFIQDIPLAKGDAAWDIVANVEQNLPQFQNTPTLICWGMHDFVFDHHFLTRFQQLLPHAQTHQFPDAGHYLLEDSHEQVIPLVKKFLASS